MRVVFMGTPAFAVPSLRALASAHRIVAVYARPDKPSGRGREPKPSPVKEAALELGLPVRQPPTLRDDAALKELRDLAPDVVCVAAFGLILPRPVLDVPKHGCVNVHASLLPRWRGAAPIQRAILAGDDTTGVSIMRMEEGLDTGPYAEQVAVRVGVHDASALTEILAEVGAAALLRALGRIEDGTVTWTPQSPAGATYADKVSRADVAIDPSLPAADALRRIRASSPQAPCRMRIAGTDVTVLTAMPATDSPGTGRVGASARDLVAGFSDGALRLERVVPAGRKPMEGAAWARGARLPAGADWEGIG